MIEWFSTAQTAIQRFAALRDEAQHLQEQVYGSRELGAWCECCRRQSKLSLVGSAAEWVNLRESLLCPCGMNSRMRMIMSAFAESAPSPRFLMFERITPLFELVRKRFPFVEGCEYFGSDVKPGTMHLTKGVEVRHEDLMALSYRDRTFRTLFHGDVLEHVPDLQRALSECHRVLDVGGTLVFTCPMTNLEQHIVRARLVSGTLVHDLPPGYHGNPMDENGALVFTEPGLALLDDLRAAGFGRVELGLAYDPDQGILRDGNPYEDFNMWPIIFRATRLS